LTQAFNSEFKGALMRAMLKFGKWAAVALLAVVGATAHAQLTQGKDYLAITPPQPAPPGKNVEVIEFFWYGCPHCYHLQPALHAWLKKKPADVTVRSQPAAFNESWLPMARAFYAAEAIGVNDRLHGAVFEAIHKTKKLDLRQIGRDPKPLFDWVASQGVDRKKFADAYNSFAVISKTNRVVDATSAYGISGTPSLAIDGRYLTAPHMISQGGEPDYARFFRVVDQLIDMARAQRKGK
jgi:thiol:disulfide interchange protein DsbA